MILKGVHAPANDKDNYSLVYSDFIPSLVKATQELNGKTDAQQEQINSLQDENAALKTTNAALQTQVQQMNARLDQFESSLSQCCSSYMPATGQNNLSLPNTANTVNNGTSDVASLQQNVPNPFNSSTYIQYYLPSTASAGTLVITDMNGQTLKQFNISNSGFGKLSINPGQFAQGTYTYSLFVDGKMIDTKQMILTK